MKNSFLALTACALCTSVAVAAPAPKTPAKMSAAKPIAKTPAKVADKAPLKVAAKSAPTTAAKTSAKATAVKAPVKVAQATTGLMAPEQMPGFFPDVPRDHWAFAAVQRLAAAGIVNGYPAGTAPKPAKIADASAEAKEAKGAEVKNEIRVAEKTETGEETKVAEKTEVAPERVAALPAAPEADAAK